MSGAPARGTAPRRQRRQHQHHHHNHHRHHRHHHHHKRRIGRTDAEPAEEPEEKRPKVNPIFLWASQREQRIVEVRCEDYDKRNRIKLTKTAQGWRSIPRTASNAYPTLAVDSHLSRGDRGQGKENERAIESGIIGRDSMRPNGRVEADSGRRGIARREADRADRKRTIARDTEERMGRYDEEEKEEEEEEDEEEEVVVVEEEDDDDSVSRDSSGQILNCTGYRYEEDRRDTYSYNGEHDDYSSSSCDLEENSDKSAEEREEVSRKVKREEHRSRALQPRVVLEQLHLSRLPGNVHRSFLDSLARRELEKEAEAGDEDEDEEDDVERGDEEKDSDKEPATRNDEKSLAIDDKDLEDIFHMLETTNSPALATDTLSADLPSPNSTRTTRNDFQGRIESSKSLGEMANGPRSIPSKDETSRERNFTDRLDEEFRIATKAQSRKVDEKEEPLRSTTPRCESEVKPQTEASSLLSTWQNAMVVVNSCPDVEELAKATGCNDSSRILKALRNTPGLSISIATKANATREESKRCPVPAAKLSEKSPAIAIARDTETAATVPIAAVGQPVTVEVVKGGRANDRVSPRSLPGLSITIPSYQYHHPKSASGATPVSPAKHHADSPESTVNFPACKAEGEQPRRLDLEDVRFEDEMVEEEEEEEEEEEDDDEEEEEDDEEEEEEEEDDCDSQVLEDLRRQDEARNRDFSINGATRGSFDEEILEDTRNRNGVNPRRSHFSLRGRSNEAVAKSSRLQDLERLNEQVLGDLRSRGTVVSPEPSGIPSSPASRRPSSAYLERLLPSPPCSVSCSEEDAKNDLTLKGILASPSRLDSRSLLEYDRSRDREAQQRLQQRRPSPSSHLGDETEPKLADRHPTARTIQRGGEIPERTRQISLARIRDQNRGGGGGGGGGQETRNGVRPTSGGDIDGYARVAAMDHATRKRPLSAELATRDGRRRPSDLFRMPDPAAQLRVLVKTSGHLIPDPLLVPRDRLPALAAAPATEIPKLLTSRPELRLPEALTRPELLRDPDLLVISLAHLQHVLDQGEGPIPSVGSYSRGSNGSGSNPGGGMRGQARPKLSCRPIGTLMPAPIDLSNNRRQSPYPPLSRMQSGLLKQEPEVTSTASSPEDSQLWHPLFGSRKRQQQQQQQQQQPPPPPPPLQQQQQHKQHRSSWHRTTLTS